MKTVLTALAVALFVLLAADAKACDYNRNIVVKQIVVANYVQPVYAQIETPYVGSQVAVVPFVGSYGYSFGYNAAIVQRQIVVKQQFRNGRQVNAGGSGVVGIARAAFQTVGNVVGAVVGR